MRERRAGPCPRMDPWERDEAKTEEATQREKTAEPKARLASSISNARTLSAMTMAASFVHCLACSSSTRALSAGAGRA